mmetsp:Transcript_6333/g.14044  ORF Transcript_6333/g.14044 Transcript_6333/m.14044 type:complete len:80 (+) Transcript_6333:549-788(+)
MLPYMMRWRMAIQQKSLPPFYSSQVYPGADRRDIVHTSASFKSSAVSLQHSSSAARSAAHGIYTQNTLMKLASANTNRM